MRIDNGIQMLDFNLNSSACMTIFTEDILEKVRRSSNIYIYIYVPETLKNQVLKEVRDLVHGKCRIKVDADNLDYLGLFNYKAIRDSSYIYCAEPQIYLGSHEKERL